jgi:hypothetical protein
VRELIDDLRNHPTNWPSTSFPLTDSEAMRLVAAFDTLLDLTKKAKRPHFWCDGDNWFSCPKAQEGCANDAAGTECNCGADERNAEIDAKLKEIGVTDASA